MEAATASEAVALNDVHVEVSPAGEANSQPAEGTTAQALSAEDAAALEVSTTPNLCCQ